MALSGAPRKESGLTRQLLVGEEEDVLYFKLPGTKKKQACHTITPIGVEDIFTGSIQNKTFNYSFRYFVGQNWKIDY